MAPLSNDNFNKCISGLQSLLLTILPSLQHALDTWHHQIKQNIQPCTNPTQCPQKKKPSTKNNACQECIDWAAAIEAEVYPSSAIGSLQWTNVKSTLFSSNPLEVIKLFVLRIQGTQSYSLLADFDHASLIAMMGKFKRFHQGDRDVFDKIQKVSFIRNCLAHFKLNDNLQLDDLTFNAFWKDMTELVDELERLGLTYFTKQTAEELRKKLHQIKTEAAPVQLAVEVLRHILAEDLILEHTDELKQKQHQLQQGLSELGIRSDMLEPVAGVVELCRVSSCNEEVFVACPLCNVLLCQQHFEVSTCDEHTKEQAGVEHLTQPSDQTPIPGTLSDEQLVQRIAHDLTNYYKNSYCKKQMYLWKPGNYVDLDSIYVPVTIDIVLPGMRPIKERLRSYRDIFASQTDTRYILSGNQGQGKSTLCSKLAHDWCNKSEETLSEVELLFILELARIDHQSTIEDAICAQLLSFDVESSTLHNILQKLGRRVVVVLDGLDEAPPDLFQHEEFGNLVDIIRYKHLRECHVLLTTRPCREREITTKFSVFKRLEMQKLTRSDVIDFVKKIFRQNPDEVTTVALGNRLLRYISENRLLVDVSSPLMVLLISWYWTETGGKDIPHRITELYDEIIEMMQRSSNITSAKESIVRRLGEVSVLGSLPTNTRTVFTESEVYEYCGNEVLQQAQAMGIIQRRGENLLQFFHKSVQEYCTGIHLRHNAETLCSYVQSVRTVQDALNAALVLTFASVSREVAGILLDKLVSIFKMYQHSRGYYKETLPFDEMVHAQNFIELCLECNFAADAKTELTSILADLFVDGKVLFYGISLRAAYSLAYFMRFCHAHRIRDITIRPVAHTSHPALFSKPNAKIFNTALQRMKSVPSDRIQQIHDTFVENNQDLHDDWKLFTPTQMVAYISCIQASEGMPSSWETNIAPIIQSFKYIELERLNIDYLKLGEAYGYLSESVENGDLRTILSLNVASTASTEQQITRLVKSVHKMPLLRVLDISDNKAEIGHTIPILACNLKHCTSLSGLYVGHMQASAQDMMFLAQNLPKRLIGLAIDGNEMNDEVASFLTVSLPRTLTNLLISIHFLSTCKHNELLDSIVTHLGQLKSVYIWDSPYPSDLVMIGSQMLTSCKRLKKVGLHSTCTELLSAHAVKALVRQVHRAKKVEQLSLYGIRVDCESFQKLLTACRVKYLVRLEYQRDLLPTGIQPEELDDFVVLE